MPHFSSRVSPLRKQVNQEKWIWTTSMEADWQRLKESIKNLKKRTLYDPKGQVIVQSDASPHGIGAVLLQNGQPVLFASRKLTPAEANYAQIEKEALGALYAMKRFRIFLLGNYFTIQTDHQSLLALWKKTLDEISSRLKRLFLAMYSFTFTWE